MQDLFFIDVQVFGHEACIIYNRDVNRKTVLIAIAYLQIHRHSLILQDHNLLEGLLVHFSISAPAITLNIPRQGHLHPITGRFSLSII